MIESLILSTKIRRDFHIGWEFKASAVTRLAWNFIWKYDTVSIWECGVLVGHTKRIAGARRGNVANEKKRAQRGFALADETREIGRRNAEARKQDNARRWFR
jgi:hypothetical protein